MKKATIFLVFTIVVILLPCNVTARIFTLYQEQLSKFGEVYEDPGGGYTFYIAEGNPYNPYPSHPEYFTGPVEGGYQFFGQVWNRPESIENWGEIGVGSVLIKAASWQRDTLEEIGATDLTGYDKFVLNLLNIKNPPRIWSVNLFIETGYSDLGEPNERYYGGWHHFESGDSAILTLDLASVDNLNHVTSIGFAIGSDFAPSAIDLYVFQAYPVAYTIDEILDYFANSCSDGSIIGLGSGNSANKRLNAFGGILETAADLINLGDIEGACQQLLSAYEKCDGVKKPKDFVTGEAAAELAGRIDDLMIYLGCY